jgi:hypothetical protein
VKLHRQRKKHVRQTPNFTVRKSFHRVFLKPFIVAEMAHPAPQIACLNGIEIQNQMTRSKSAASTAENFNLLLGTRRFNLTKLSDRIVSPYAPISSRIDFPGCSNVASRSRD